MLSAFLSTPSQTQFHLFSLQLTHWSKANRYACILQWGNWGPEKSVSLSKAHKKVEMGLSQGPESPGPFHAPWPLKVLATGQEVRWEVHLNLLMSGFRLKMLDQWVCRGWRTEGKLCVCCLWSSTFNHCQPPMHCFSFSQRQREPQMLSLALDRIWPLEPKGKGCPNQKAKPWIQFSVFSKASPGFITDWP